MRRKGSAFPVLIAGVCFLAAASCATAIAGNEQPRAIEVAQATEPTPGELQPRYQPVPPQEKSSYNSDYIFGMTKGVANSNMVPALKAPLFVLSIPLDLVCLPFEAIGGFFG